MDRLDGKVAVVTGGARGSGEQIARVLAAEGASVAIIDIQAERGKAVAADLNSGLFIEGDVSEPKTWVSVTQRVESEFGQVNILVNNAAVLHLGSIEDTTAEEFARLQQVNVLGVFLGVKAVIDPMRRAGGGSIINISSVDAITPSEMTAAYSASKFGIEGITRVAAMELTKDNIRVNSVMAGYGSAEMLLDASGPFKPSPRVLAEHDRAERLKLGARVVLFLASDESAAITGANVAADFGHTAGARLPAQ